MDNYPYSKYIFEPRLLSDENPILGDIIFRNNQGDYTTVVNIFNKESCSRLNIDAFPLEELKNDIVKAKRIWDRSDEDYFIICDSKKVNLFTLKNGFHEYQKTN